MANQFPVISVAAYLLGAHERPAHSWHAFWFVRAIKGESVKGTSYIPVRGATRLLTGSNAHQASGWFGEMAADRLAAVLRHGMPPAIVPIPPSSLTRDQPLTGTPSRLAHALASQIGGEVYDVLRWDVAQQSARSGGPRSADLLYPHLVVTGKPAAGSTCILVDDVYTTGGHVAAAARRMREVACPVVIAVAAGKTLRGQIPANSFLLPPDEQLEYDPDDVFWDTR